MQSELWPAARSLSFVLASNVFEQGKKYGLRECDFGECSSFNDTEQQAQMSVCRGVHTAAPAAGWIGVSSVLGVLGPPAPCDTFLGGLVSFQSELPCVWPWCLPGHFSVHINPQRINRHVFHQAKKTFWGECAREQVLGLCFCRFVPQMFSEHRERENRLTQSHFRSSINYHAELNCHCGVWGLGRSTSH